MRIIAILFAVLFSACGLTNDRCGLDYDYETKNYSCSPHSGSTRQFWVDTPHTIYFYRSDCTRSRITGSMTGEPVPSDPERGECFAVAVSSVDPPRDCETSFSQYSGYNACVRAVNFGGSIACGDPP